MSSADSAKGWRHTVFSQSENEIAKYCSCITDYGEWIKYSDLCLPKMSRIFEEFDNYVHINKNDLKNITFDQLVNFLKKIKNVTKKHLVQYLSENQIPYEEGLWSS